MPCGQPPVKPDVRLAVGATMNKPIRFSLFALLFAFLLTSAFMAASKAFGIKLTSIGVIAVCATISLGLAARVFFFNR